MSYFGDQILQLRKKEGLSQEEFAYRIGVSRQIVSRWENGVAIPRSTKVKIICNEFNVSPNSLFGTEDSKIEDEISKIEIKDHKKSSLLLKKIIIVIFSTVLLSYLLLFFRNLYVINYLDKQISEFEKWKNYYAEIELFPELDTKNKYIIWYKDNNYKIVIERYEKNELVDKKTKIVDCINRIVEETDLSGENTKKEMNQSMELTYLNGVYVNQFFIWMKDIRDSKISIALLNKVKTRKGNRRIIEFDKKVVILDSETYMPISYSDMLKDDFKVANYKIQPDVVSDEEIKKDLQQAISPSK